MAAGAEAVPAASIRAGTLRLENPDYPDLLRRMPDPPKELYWRGDPGVLSRTAVAVVGARRATRLGIAMAERLAGELASRGVVIVSGCAYGIDAAAHRAALAVGGTTVAVLAGGLDVPVVRPNRGLAARIAAEGCLVSEWPAKTEPHRWSFPVRNRIIAGLSRITVVVEAGRTSGALSTAGHALAAGREVLAVPGHPLLESSHAGSNGLIADGARPARSPDDVLEELLDLPGVEEELARYARTAAESPPDPAAAGSPGAALARVLAALESAPRPLEAVAARVGGSVPALMAALTRLELLGLVRSHGASGYSLPPPPPSPPPTATRR